MLYSSKILNIIKIFLLIALSISLYKITVIAQTQKEDVILNTFMNWCLNQTNLSLDTKKTINILLEKAATQDCSQAYDRLSKKTQLSLVNRQISDLTPLRSLSNLTHLYLWNNQITDLTPLKYLTNLTTLHLANNKVSDLTPLDSLTKLTSLNLSKNNISSLNGFQSLTNILWLDISHNQITEISELQSASKLKILFLKNNQISSLTGLAFLTNLSELNLSNNQIIDTTPLQYHSTIKGLYLNNNQITNLNGLSNLSELTILNLSKNYISDINSLSYLINLSWLNLSENQIYDVSPIRQLNRLNNLILKDNQINDITPLQTLINLSWLDLKNNQITNINPLKYLVNLNNILVQNNPLAQENCPVTPEYICKFAETTENQNTKIKQEIDPGIKGNSVGLIPLSEMTEQDKYYGEDAGLYGSGMNKPPALYQALANKKIEQIQPLDSQGQPSESGLIGLVCIGMSNTKQKCSAFQKISDANIKKSEKVVIVNGAQGGKDVTKWGSHNDASIWQELDRRLQNKAVTDNQVQAIWLENTLRLPHTFGKFPEHNNILISELKILINKLQTKFPNLKVIYLSSRSYGGYYAERPASPEPYAYENGFAIRSLIQERMEENMEENLELNSTLLLWGPYIWADGTNLRDDGLRWQREDFAIDGIHLSRSGMEKVGNLLFDFFTTDINTKNWFCANQCED